MGEVTWVQLVFALEGSEESLIVGLTYRTKSPYKDQPWQQEEWSQTASAYTIQATLNLG